MAPVGAYGVGPNLEAGFSAKTAVRSDKIRPQSRTGGLPGMGFFMSK